MKLLVAVALLGVAAFALAEDDVEGSLVELEDSLEMEMDDSLGRRRRGRRWRRPPPRRRPPHRHHSHRPPTRRPTVFNPPNTPAFNSHMNYCNFPNGSNSFTKDAATGRDGYHPGTQSRFNIQERYRCQTGSGSCIEKFGLVPGKKVMLNNLIDLPEKIVDKDGVPQYVRACKAGPWDSKEGAGQNGLYKYHERHVQDWMAPNGRTMPTYEPCNAQSAIEFEMYACDLDQHNHHDQKLAKALSLLGLGNLLFHGQGCGKSFGQELDTYPMDLLFGYFVHMAMVDSPQKVKWHVDGMKRDSKGVYALTGGLIDGLWNIMQESAGDNWSTKVEAAKALSSNHEGTDRSTQVYDKKGFYPKYTCSIIRLVLLAQKQGLCNGIMNEFTGLTDMAFHGEMGKCGMSKKDSDHNINIAYNTDSGTCIGIKDILFKFIQAQKYNEGLGTPYTQAPNYAPYYKHNHDVPCKYVPHAEWHVQARKLIAQLHNLAETMRRKTRNDSYIAITGSKPVDNALDNVGSFVSNTANAVGGLFGGGRRRRRRRRRR